jgi:hypothetical protein
MRFIHRRRNFPILIHKLLDEIVRKLRSPLLELANEFLNEVYAFGFEFTSEQTTGAVVLNQNSQSVVVDDYVSAPTSKY